MFKVWAVYPHSLKIEEALKVLHNASQQRPIGWNRLQPYDAHPKLQSLLPSPPLLWPSSFLFFSSYPLQGRDLASISLLSYSAFHKSIFPLSQRTYTHLTFSQNTSHFDSLAVFTSVVFCALSFHLISLFSLVILISVFSFTLNANLCRRGTSAHFLFLISFVSLHLAFTQNNIAPRVLFLFKSLSSFASNS